jgi:uncharacterized membrane protein
LVAILQKSFSLEEALSLDAAVRPLPDTIHQALTFENQSPNYYVLLHYWTLVSSSILWSRLLSLGMVICSVILTWKAGRELHDVQPVILALLLAICPQVLWAATEVRSYPLVLLTVSASWLWFGRTWFGTASPRVRDLVAYFVACYLAVTSFYYAVFVIAGQWLAALAFSRHRRELFIGGALYTVAFLPWIPIILAQFASRPTVVTHVVPAIERGRGVLSTFRLLTQLLISSPISDRVVFSVGWVVLVAGALGLMLYQSRRTRLPPETKAVLVGVAISVVIPWLLWATGITIVYARHWMPVVPGAVLALAVVLTLTTPNRLRCAVTTGVALAFTCGVISLYRNLSAVDWKRLALGVEAQRRADEPVLFFPSRGMLIYRPYGTTTTRTFGLPDDVRLVKYPLDSSMTIRDATDISNRLAEVTSSGTFWLVVDPGFRGFGDDTLASYVADRCEVLDSVSASGLGARRLRCR